MELRWFKHARSLSYILQFRELEGPTGEDRWGEWQTVEHVREQDEVRDSEDLDDGC